MLKEQCMTTALDCSEPSSSSSGLQRSKDVASKPAEASPFNGFNLFGNAQGKLPRDVGIVGTIFFFGMLVFYIFHCCWVSAEMYSAPSIVLQSRTPQGGVHVFDDFREAYGWLRHNTDEEAKVSSVRGLSLHSAQPFLMCKSRCAESLHQPLPSLSKVQGAFAEPGLAYSMTMFQHSRLAHHIQQVTLKALRRSQSAA